MAKGKRGIQVLIAVLLVGFLGALGGGFFLWRSLPGFVMKRIQAEAAARGVNLKQCKLELGWEHLTLRECEFSLAKTAQVAGTIETIDVYLEGLKPSKLELAGAAVAIYGTPEFDELFEDRKPGQEAEIPVEVTQSKLEWLAVVGQPPRLSLTDVRYSMPSGTLSSKVDIAEILQGSVERQGDVVDLQLALKKSPSAKVSVRVQQAKEVGELRLEFEKLALSELDGPWMPIPKDLQEVRASTNVFARIPIGLSPQRAQGDFRLTLDGLNFPVPLELQGLVYGTPLEMSGNFELDRSFTRAQLSKLRLSVGALNMRGAGRAELDGTAVAFDTSLTGNLPCDAIVRSAAAAHVDTELAKVAGRIARLALDGSVTILAIVQARTDALAEATVIKSVGVGCGLKPLPIKGLEDLPGEVLKRLPKLPGLPDPSKLPPPSERPKLELPRLPELPKLPFPRRKIRDDEGAQPDSQSGGHAREGGGNGAPLE